MSRDAGFGRLLMWLALVLLGSTGCTNVGPAGPFGAGWSSTGTGSKGFGSRVSQAAREAAFARRTWLPLAGAAILAIGSLDEDLAQWASDETPLYGNNAARWSDDLRDFTTLSYFAAAAFAPSERLTDRLGGVAVGVGTMVVEGAVTEGLKSLSSRQRPNGRGDRSHPSGHAAQASSRAALTLQTLRHYEMAPWQRQVTEASYLGIASAAAWARVEADKHYPTDVLVGFAIGQFLAQFTQNLFLDGATTVAVLPQPGGATLTLRVPLR